MKYRYLISFMIAGSVAALFTQTQAGAQSTPPSSQQETITVSSVCDVKATYDQLTNDERKPPPPRRIQLGKSRVELTISATEFSDQPVDPKRASSPDFCEWNTLWVGVNVSTTGEVSSFANGEGSFRGGGGGKLAPEIFARLESLMNRLPDDHNRVPPTTRRIVVEVERHRAATVRLYDSALLPDVIVEMIRLTGARVNIVKPVFQPESVLSAEEAASLNLPALLRNSNDLTISPDGSISILDDSVSKTLTVYEGSTWPENGGLPRGGKIIRVIQEFWQPPQPGGYWVVNCEFSPDGRYLLVSWGDRIGALLFDTAIWQPVTDPHLFPQNLKEYLHSPDWSLGIAVTGAGETLVWDQQSRRVLSKLPGLGELEPAPIVTDQRGHRIYDIPNAEIRSAAFSPDGTRVAIYSGPNDIFKLRLSIWDPESGQKLRDFWPVVWSSYPNGEPVWWDNGRLIVASYSSQFSGGGVGVWDAKIGRFMGTLGSSASCNLLGSPVVIGERLLQRCSAGEVLEWSAEGVRKQLEAFGSQISGAGSSPKIER